MGNVVINGRTSVHAGSGGTLKTKDVCKTPGKCRARTYTNIAVSADSAMTASTVIVNGNPACHIQSIFSKSTGDEGGSCGGVASGTIKQKAQFVSASSNVFLEGKPATRQNDKMISNNANTPPSSLMQAGAAQPPSLSPKGAAEVELRKTDYLLDPVLRCNSIPEDLVGRFTSVDLKTGDSAHTIIGSSEKISEWSQMQRWRMRIDNVEDRDHNLYLSYEDKSSPCKEILSKLDKKKIPVEEDRYHIPLGKLDAERKSRPATLFNDIELMPTFPLRLLKHNKNTCVSLRKGYLYLFLNDHLWREIEYDPDFSTFRDINLTRYQGCDRRPAYSQRQGRLVLLPIALKNLNESGKSVDDIKFAFSEQQWSWSYIERLGGMDKKDPRYIPDLEIYKKRQKQNRVGKLDQKFRDKRLQKVEIKDYYPESNYGGDPRKEHKVSLSSALSENTSYVSLYKSDTDQIEHLSIHDVLSGSPALVCRDSVGEARDLALGFKGILAIMKRVMDEVSGQKHPDVMSGEEPDAKQKQEIQNTAIHYRMAAVITQYLYSSTKLEAPGYLTKEQKKVFNESRKERRGLKDQLEEPKLFKYTKQKERKHLRVAAVKAKRKLVDFLRDERSPYNFTIAMQDQFTMEGKDYYFIAAQTMGEVIKNLLDTIDVQQAAISTDSFNELDYLRDDPGVQYMIDLFGAGKNKPILHKYLFAQEKGNGDSLYDYKEIDIDAGKGDFSVARLKAAIRATQNEGDGEPDWVQTARRASEFLTGFSETHANVAHVLYKAMDTINKQQKVADVKTGKIKTDQAIKKKLAAEYKDLIAATKKWKHLLNHGLRVFRIVGIIKIEELNIPVEYAVRGPFPKGYTPMDIAYRQASAQKRLSELLDQNKTNLGARVGMVDQFGNTLGSHPLARALSLHAELAESVEKILYRHETGPLSGDRVGAIFIQDGGGTPLMRSFTDGEVDKLLEDGIKEIEAEKAKLEKGIQQNAHEIAQNRYVMGIKIPSKVKREALARAGYNAVILPAMAFANVANLYFAAQNFYKRGDFESKLYLASAILDTTALSIDVAQIVGRHLAGAPSAAQMAAASRLGWRVFSASGTPGVARLAMMALRLNIAASVLTAGVSLYDMVKAMSINDTGAAIGNATIAAGSVLFLVSASMAISSAATGSAALLVGLGATGVGLVAVAIILIGAAIIYWFSNTPMETWLKNCPWGKSAYGGRFDAWKTRPDSAYYELMGLLNKPTIEFDSRYDGDRDIILNINTQGFNLKQAELELKLEYKTNKGTKGDLTLSAGTNKQPATGGTKIGKGITPTIFWHYAKVVLQREPLAVDVVHGLKIYMTRQMFAELKGQGAIEFKASCRVWPLGKNQTISSHSKLQYSLPAPEFDSNGNPKLNKVKDATTGQLVEQQPVAIDDEEIDLRYGDKPLPGPIRSDEMAVSPTMA